VIDFTDVPLSENWGRNEGLSYEHAMRALNRLLRSSMLAGLTITELNPDHAERAERCCSTAIAHGLAGRKA
jgi:arginase